MVGKSLRTFALLALLTPAVVHAGDVVFERNFNDGTTGLVNGTLSRFSVASGQGPDASNALLVTSQGASFEAFWGLGQAVGGAGNVVRISYDFRLGANPFAQQRLYLLGTYSDQNKGNYRAMIAAHNRSIEPTAGTFAPSYQVRAQADGNVIANPLTAAMNLNQWYSIDLYINTDQVVPAGAFRTFTRVLTADQTTSLGASVVLPPTGPDGTIYTDWSIRALQFFNSPNAPFAGFGNQMYFDNVKVEYMTTDDLTRVTRDAFAATGGARSTFNNDGSVNATDATVFIEQVMATRAGDANFDRKVDFDDLGLLLGTYDQAGDWAGGDFDGDGIVTFDDLGVLLGNYGFGVEGAVIGQLDAQAAALLASVAVPEPTVAGIAAGLALAGLRRRRD